MQLVPTLAGIALGSRDPRHPGGPRRRRRAHGLGLPAAGHQPGQPARLPARARRRVRLDDDPRPGLVDLPARPGSHRAASPRGRSRRSSTATCRVAAGEAHDVDTSALPPPVEIDERRRKRSTHSPRSRPTHSTSGRCCAASDASRGEAQTTVDAVLAEGVVPGLEERTSRVFTYTFETGGKPEAGDSVWDRVTNRISNTFRTNPPHYLIVQLQPAESPRRPGRRSRRTSPRPSRARRWSRPCSCATSASGGCPPRCIVHRLGLIFGLLCAMLHKRDQRVSRTARRPCPPPTGG